MVDQWMPEIGICMARVLERLGHTVTYDSQQTCCGRPAFDSGRLVEAAAIARRQLGIFADAEVIVTPSVSCAAMMRREYGTLITGDEAVREAHQITERVHEFGDFLVNRLHVEEVGARFQGTVAVQECCNTRRSGGAPGDMRRLLSKVAGLRIVDEPDSGCCGFGGPFSMQFPLLSSSMGMMRTDSVLKSAAQYYVSNDPACLLQMRGIMGRRAKPVRGLHLAEVLASL